MSIHENSFAKAHFAVILLVYPTWVTKQKFHDILAFCKSGNSLCCAAIQVSKEHEIDEGFADVIEKGWLIKEGANDDSRRKR